MQIKYGYCNCGNKTIIQHLPLEIMEVIYGYVPHQTSHLKCPQCDFINENNVIDFIKQTGIKFEYSEEDDPAIIEKYLVNNNIISIYKSQQWNKLKNKYFILNLSGNPDENATLLQLNCINIFKNNKPILFEIPSTKTIMSFICQISLFTMIIAEDPYEQYNDDVGNVDDDFVAGDWYEENCDDDVDDDFDY